jgi:general secretion pathway protein K
MRARIASSSRRQRGAALLTAMIIVTLVATLAAAMVWQQWRAVQVEAAERARAQAAWILSGALDFAKLILREDVRGGRQYTALTEPWATPLAESRLSTFLAVDKSNADDGPEAFLSGNIDDAQARYNLNNLVKAQKIVQEEVLILQNLCTAVGIETGIASRIATGLRDASSSNASAPLPPQSVAQLTWLPGVDEASVQALSAYVVLLPQGTPINVNTASKEVLIAVVGLDPGSAENVLQVRQRTPFKTLDAFTKLIPAEAQTQAQAQTPSRIAVRSDFFEVRGRLRLADRVLVERSLLQRLSNGQSNVLQRERIASLEQVGG